MNSFSSKSFIFLLLILILNIDVSAENLSPLILKRGYRYSYPMVNTDTYKTHNLKGGISTSTESYTGLGFQGVYSYRMNSKISIGIQACGFIEGYNDFANKRKSAFLGLRLAYFPLYSILEHSNLDVYVAVSVGGLYLNTEIAFKPLMCIGASYRLFENLGIFIELGSTANIGLHLSF